MLPAEPQAEPHVEPHIEPQAAKTWFSKLVGMRPDPDILIGGAMPEHHRVGTLAEELLDQLRHNLILIGSAQRDHKRPWHHGIGLAQESHVGAMDLEIRFLLAAAELLAMRHAAELADLPVLMLVHLPAVIPPDSEQT